LILSPKSVLPVIAVISVLSLHAYSSGQSTTPQTSLKTPSTNAITSKEPPRIETRQGMVPMLEEIRAAASMIQALAAVAILIIGAKQLKKVSDQLRFQGEQIKFQSEQLKIQGEREKKWATIRACERYDFDPTINAYTAAVFRKTKDGTDYTDAKQTFYEVIGLLNYLESLAIGVFQGVYNERIVYDHFEDIIFKAVKALIKGESGTKGGWEWVASSPVVKEESFVQLVKLYNKWYGADGATRFQDSPAT
jgi:hypothetical protein